MNYDRLKLIVFREYSTRIRGKGFILSTILAPVFLLAIFLLPILLSNLRSSSSLETFAVVDATGAVAPRMIEAKPLRYKVQDDVSIDSLRQAVIQEKITGFVYIPTGVFDGSQNAEFYNSGSGGMSLENEIRGDVADAVREELFTRTNVTDELRSIINLRPRLESKRITATGDQKVNSEASFLLAYIMGMGIYFAMFAYGALIMNGVIEEKTNRIVEVMVSTARPFELLIGKVIGIVALGLTQISIWFVAFVGITTVLAPFVMRMVSSQAGLAEGAAQAAPQMPEIAWTVWIFFAIFYLLGFLMYGGVFAAVGSAADSPQDVQQLALPVYIPLIIPMFLLMPVSTDPNSTLAVIASLIPFFSPILMMVRIVVTEVPLWQSLGSIVLMTATFFGVMWVSAKIYRTGILMYGKKVSLVEIFKWLRYR